MTSAGAQAFLRDHAARLLERKRRESQAWREVSFAAVLERCDAVISAWERAGFLSLLQADEVGAPFELLRIHLDLSAELICGAGKGSVFAKRIWELEIIRRLQELQSAPAASLGAAVLALHAYQVEVFNLIENLALARRESPWLELGFDHFSSLFSEYETTGEAVAAIERRLDDWTGVKPLAQVSGPLHWKCLDLRKEIQSVPEVTGAVFLRARILAVQAMLHQAGAPAPVRAQYYIYLDDDPVLLGSTRVEENGTPVGSEAPVGLHLCPQLPAALARNWVESEWVSVQGRRVSSLIHLGWSPA